eukprot:Rhum_TRINITY_DN15555_c0_g1::Rhum_TRINITY_DN15555_c0_g1_i1::g.161212::m.161212
MGWTPRGAPSPCPRLLALPLVALLLCTPTAHAEPSDTPCEGYSVEWVEQVGGNGTSPLTYADGTLFTQTGGDAASLARVLAMDTLASGSDAHPQWLTGEAGDTAPTVVPTMSGVPRLVVVSTGGGDVAPAVHAFVDGPPYMLWTTGDCGEPAGCWWDASNVSSSPGSGYLVSRVVHAEGTELLFASTGRRLVCLRAGGGKSGKAAVLWTYAMAEGETLHTPAVWVEPRNRRLVLVFCATDRGIVKVVCEVDMTGAWVKGPTMMVSDVPSLPMLGGRLNEAPVASGDAIYFSGYAASSSPNAGDGRHYLYCMNVTGTVVWTVDLQTFFRAPSQRPHSVAIDGDVLVFTTMYVGRPEAGGAAYVVSMDKTTGRWQWEHEVSHPDPAHQTVAPLFCRPAMQGGYVTFLDYHSPSEVTVYIYHVESGQRLCRMTWTHASDAAPYLDEAWSVPFAGDRVAVVLPQGDGGGGAGAPSDAPRTRIVTFQRVHSETPTQTVSLTASRSRTPTHTASLEADAPQSPSNTGAPRSAGMNVVELALLVGGGVGCVLLTACIFAMLFREKRRLRGARANERAENPNSVTSNYKVIKELGRGAFGVVYLVERKSDGELLAMKYLQCKDDHAQEEALTEFKFLRQFQGHPNMISVVETFMSWSCTASGKQPKPSLDGRSFGPNSTRYVCLVMPYFKRGDLKQFVLNYPDETLPEEMCLRMAEQLCSLLHYLHYRQPPLIHRDLKPENVLISDDGRPIVADFGLAKNLDTMYCATRAGTAAFLAPECWGKHYGVEVDIWAIGCILYAAATRRVQSDNIRVMFSDAAKPGFVNEIISDLTKRGYSQWFADLVVSMLDRDYHKRPKAYDIVSALRKRRETGVFRRGAGAGQAGRRDTSDRAASSAAVAGAAAAGGDGSGGGGADAQGKAASPRGLDSQATAFISANWVADAEAPLLQHESGGAEDDDAEGHALIAPLRSSPQAAASSERRGGPAKAMVAAMLARGRSGSQLTRSRTDSQATVLVDSSASCGLSPHQHLAHQFYQNQLFYGGAGSGVDSQATVLLDSEGNKCALLDSQATVSISNSAPTHEIINAESDDTTAGPPTLCQVDSQATMLFCSERSVSVGGTSDRVGRPVHLGSPPTMGGLLSPSHNVPVAEQMHRTNLNVLGTRVASPTDSEFEGSQASLLE